MPLNKIKGNMYQGWLDFTWNTVKGKCPHDHKDGYCYMKKWGKQSALHFDEKELKTDLGDGNFIFIGSSCDLFADKIPIKWIIDTLEHCRKFNNKYLFQSKNPERIYEMRAHLPKDVVLGTTIESNRIYKEMCNAPNPTDRIKAMIKLHLLGYKTTLTFEPLMDFDLEQLVYAVFACKPDWINLGANTNYKVKLQEPSPDKIRALIKELKNITEVKIKPNLKRLMKNKE